MPTSIFRCPSIPINPGLGASLIRIAFAGLLLLVFAFERRLDAAPRVRYASSSGTLVMSGSEGADRLELHPVGAFTRVTVEMEGRTMTQTMPTSMLLKVVFSGEGGDDQFINRTGIPSIANGGEGADSLTGGDAQDVLSGGPGADVLSGGGGNDRLRGGDGPDLLVAGAGDDEAWGQAGDDVVFGEEGNDYVSGDEGDDTVSGGPGNDFARGESGDDIVRGDTGDDRVQGDGGNDILLGGPGVDWILGGRERDLLVGGEGSDELNGEWGDDVLIGGGTAYDGNDAVLDSIRQIWRDETAAYGERVALLEDSEFAGNLNAGATVFDDFEIDELRGRSESDWFFLAGGVSDSSVLATLDTLVDLQPETERVNSNIPHPMNPVMRREHFALFDLVKPSDATHVALASGDWSDGTVWSGGTSPSAGARVLVPAGITVTVDRILTAAPKTLRVDGTLRFATETDTLLPVDTLIVGMPGHLEIGTASAPVAGEVTARIRITDDGEIDRDWDPFAFSRGIVNHGSASLFGEAKTAWLATAVLPAIGATTIELAEAPVNWRIGDEILVTGTRLGEFETRTILGVDGATVTVAPLALDRVVPMPDLAVHVGNLTRNVRIESDGLAVERRGHLMFMHTRDVAIAHAAFHRLGRSDKKRDVNDSVVDEAGRLAPGTGDNPRGRYAVHFHRNGVVREGQAAMVHGSVVTDNVGWGFVNHSSYVDFTENLAFNVDGAAFVTEAGDEIGRFVGNLAVHSVGSGENDEARNEVDDFGHGGDGFWFQGGGVSAVDNVAMGQAETGFIFFTRGLRQSGMGKTRFLASNLAAYHSPDEVAEIAGDQVTVDVGVVPIRDYHHNTAYACRTGSKTKWHQLNQTHGVMSRIHDLLLWGNGPITLSYEYSAQIEFADLRLIGDLLQPAGKGANPNAFTKAISFQDVSVAGFHIGIEIPQRQWTVIDGGGFGNLTNFDVQTAVEDERTVLFTGELQFHDLGIGRAQTEVRMRHRLRGNHTAFFLDRVTLDYGEFHNRRVYYHEQAAGFVPFPEAVDDLDPAVIGKTNAELWQELGVAVGGELAPDEVVSYPNIIGLVAP